MACDLGRSRERKVERSDSTLRVGSAADGPGGWFRRRMLKRGATPLCSALCCDTHSAHPNIPAANVELSTIAG